MSFVFISYSHDDSDYAHKLADSLEAKGIEVWIDDRIDYGTRWPHVIQEKVDGCDALIVIMTPRSYTSDWVQNELSRAKRKDKTVLPLLLEGDCWLSVEATQWVDVRHGKLPPAGFYTRLAQVVPVRTERAPEPLPERPRRVETPPPDLIIIDKPIRLELVHIPAGKFLMGDDKKSVHVDEFYIGKYPVTNEQYAPFVRAGGTAPKHWEKGRIPSGKQDHPVVYVSWNDAVAYCTWLSKETGRGFRLPTEEEWEKAARGPDGWRYPWGDTFDQNKCNTLASDLDMTTPVGTYSSKGGDSPYAVADMADNVREWTDSWYDAAQNARVLRGGSFNDYVRSARCAFRYGSDPDDRYDYYGFRVCVSPGL